MAQRRSVSARSAASNHLDPVPPGLAPLREPAADRGSVATVEDAQHLAAVGIHDRAHPRLDPPPTSGPMGEPADGSWPFLDGCPDIPIPAQGARALASPTHHAQLRRAAKVVPVIPPASAAEPLVLVARVEAEGRRSGPRSRWLSSTPPREPAAAYITVTYGFGPALALNARASWSPAISCGATCAGTGPAVAAPRPFAHVRKARTALAGVPVLPCSPSAGCWPRCPPGPPVRCSSCWPPAARVVAVACCWLPLRWARSPGRGCCGDW